MDGDLTQAFMETIGTMWDSEEELQEFIKTNLDVFKKDEESLVRIGKARSLFD